MAHSRRVDDACGIEFHFYLSMRNRNIANGTLVLSLLLSMMSTAQVENVVISQVGEYEFSWTYSAYTSQFDINGQPNIYAACSELGVVSFNVEDLSNPNPVDTLLPGAFGGLRPTNFVLRDNYLFASLGGFQGFPQNAGLAIVEVSDPENLEVVATWTSPDFNQGAAIAVVDGDYAFLGAMEEGVIILDISNVNLPTFVSQYAPDPNFPDIPGLFTTPNARGMEVVDDLVHLCYDHGGYRIIDVSVISSPVQIAQYINWDLYDIAAPAYNNIAVYGTVAYIAVDYCGLDIIDISDPQSPQNVGWINPWDCDITNWDGRPGHTNQLVIDQENELLYLSGGDSEILVYDISIPHQPDLVGQFVELDDLQVSWGVGISGTSIVTAMVDNPLGVPYDSNWGGIQIFNRDIITRTNDIADVAFNLFPNPTTNQITISTSVPHFWEVHNAAGQLLDSGYSRGKFQLNVSDYASGLYVYNLITKHAISQCTFSVQ